MTRRTADRCPTPPHRHHAVAGVEQSAEADTPAEGHLPEGQLKVAARATYRWFRAAPAERTPLLGGVALYGAGALAHANHLPWWGIGLVTVAGSIATYAAAMNRLDDWRIGGATAATATSGAWLATAAELGPVGGPSGLLTWGFLTTYGIGYALHRMGLKPKAPEVVVPQVPRIDWEAYFEDWGLAGARVVKAEPTRLGERVLLDTKGTGKLASSFKSTAMAERIAEDFGIAAGRVQVKTGRIAGQLSIALRLKDPWAQPIAHPMLDPDTEIPLPDVADVRRPLVIGQDPETGEALELIVWDEDGASHIMVVAIKGGGKTVFLNCTMERLTAADNVAVFGIDVSKAKDMRRWRDSGAIELAACGPKERVKAVKILEFAADLIAHRAEHNTDAVFEPRYGHPMVLVVIDEVDTLVTGGDGLAQRAQAALTTITSKGRSESVGVILVGQRGTAQWLGGGNIRANLDRFVFLKVARKQEMATAAGELGLELPDMSRYGEGKPGVVVIADLGGDSAKGRTFKLKELDDVSRIAEGREPSPLEDDVLADAKLGKLYAKLKADTGDGTSSATDPGTADDPGEGGGPSSPDDRAAERASIKASLKLVPTLAGEVAAKVRQHSAARWEMFNEIEQAAASPVPADVRARVLGLLAEGERAKADIAAEIGYSDTHTIRLLNQLRGEGVVDVRGKGPATRWFALVGEHTA
ncbi:helix-turn-helix domain-containing protein [Streptosporangium sp. G11]|uniref:helix-turn-helix domain-containing protein n=1 Tax=Streptosporangium sp. G11 TaxID=3436926 RepID=UPI003EC0BCCD